MSVHDGHRQRLRSRFLKEGLDNFEQINALELLLFYCIPRKDTNELAHALIDHFGSFHQVMDATPEELMAVPGIGEGTATFLPLISAACRYYRVSQVKNVCVLDTIEKCGDYLVNFFHARKNEMVFLLCLDAKCKVIVCREVGEGRVNSAGISARKVTEIALGAKATTAILAHNHPSGIAVPSDDDVVTTRQIARSLGAVGITLADHIVVAEDDYVSMAQSGLYHVDDCLL